MFSDAYSRRRTGHRHAVILVLTILLSTALPVELLRAASSPEDNAAAPVPEADFADIRAGIRSAPSRVADDLDHLADFLSNLASADQARAYAVFYWLSQNIAYDTNGLFTGDFGDLSPEAVLMRREAVCSGYSRLFQALATRMGLESREVTGVAKAYDWSDGGKLGAHAWNAVRIDGRWQLIDATWGAGHLDKGNRFKRETNEFYFLAPPAQLIYTHFPEDASWQLLPQPISERTFTDLPKLGSKYFSYGLLPPEGLNAVLTVRKRSAITIDYKAKTLVSASLQREGLALPDNLVFVEQQSGKLKIDVLLPKTGSYVLRIFAKPVSQKGSLDQVAVFLVNALEGAGIDAEFPKQMIDYQRFNVSNLRPMRFRLQSEGTHRFQAQVPNSADVQLVDAEGQWHPLDSIGALYQGDLKLPRGPIKLFAAPGGHSGNFRLLATWLVD